ncbi:MAG: hypothetical protein U9R00_00365 [Patescibacteria group bacterium]|nr:hypothetical protein [Patescibacteria group bacterium]
MDIKDLNKRQMILLTLLVTFVVSIATAIITASIMEQAPAAVPQTVNRVIQNTIEKVTKVTNVTVPVEQEEKMVYGSDNSLISIYKEKEKVATEEELEEGEEIDLVIGQGILVSESGLILIDSKTIKGEEKLQAKLGEEMFNVKVLKEFLNGFTVLKITIEEEITEKEEIEEELVDKEEE